MAISADGKSYAALSEAEDGKVYLIVYDADDAMAKPVLFDLGENRTGRFYLTGGVFALIEFQGLEGSFVSASGLKETSSARWVSLNIETGNSISFFDNLTGLDYNYVVQGSGEILATVPGDARKTVFSRADVRATGSALPTRFDEGQEELTYALHQVDVGSGRTRRLEWGRHETSDWVVDAEGEVAMRIDRDEQANEVLFFQDAGGRVGLVSKVKFGTETISDLRIVGRGPDADIVIMSVASADGEWSYRPYDVRAGVFTSAGYVPSIRDQIIEYYDARRAVAHAVIIGDGKEVHHFHPADQMLQQSMEKLLVGAEVFIESASAGGERVLLKAFYTDKPTEWYLYDRAAKRLEIIGRN